MSLAYAIITCVLLPRLRILGNLQGQSYPFIGISCLYGIWMLINGAYISFDGINIAVFSYCLWMITSILWAEKPYALLEIILWISYFVLFLAGRTIPTLFVMGLLSINVIIVTMQQLFKILVQKKINAVDKFPLFGNSNWNGSFLLIGFYILLWMSLNFNILFLIITILTGYAVILTKCRGAILGLLVSFGIYSILSLNLYLIIIQSLLLIISIINGRRFIKVLNCKSVNDRFIFYKDAIKKIHPRWVIGRGMNYFRDTYYGRVHNDHLEIIGELGFIGYSLLLNIFYQAHLPLIIICMIIGIFISGIFFYPFREVPLAAPIWLIIGAFSTPIISSIWLLKITGIISIIFTILFVFTLYSKLLNIVYKGKV